MNAISGSLTRRIAPRCRLTPRCPDSSRPDALAAAIVAAHPEQGWHLLCNGVVVFDDTGAIIDGHALAPRRAASRPEPVPSRVRAALRRLVHLTKGDMMHNLFGLLLAVIVLTVLGVAYLLPTLVAWIRRSPELATVAVVNVLLGWTLVGWLASLLLAVRRPALPSVHIVNQVDNRREDVIARE